MAHGVVLQFKQTDHQTESLAGKKLRVNITQTLTLGGTEQLKSRTPGNNEAITCFGTWPTIVCGALEITCPGNNTAVFFSWGDAHLCDFDGGNGQWARTALIRVIAVHHRPVVGRALDLVRHHACFQ